MLTAATLSTPSSSLSFRVATVLVRGRPQALGLYGDLTGDPVVVSSGDGGWMHLGPHIAGDARRTWILRRGIRRLGLPAKLHRRLFDAEGAG